jgi:hypothetical protein
MRRLAAWSACALLLAAHPARAQDGDDAAPAPTQREGAAGAIAAETLPVAALVDQLLRERRFDEAEALLVHLVRRRPDDEQLRFLSGMVAMARGDNARAIRTFRAMLIDHPEASRVRLELARAYFLARDYVNADRQFRLVRTSRHPAEVEANIDQYLLAIRLDKDWSWSLDLAIAPDTNLNAATASREVTLSGLPFELSDSARRKSGIGLAAEGSVEFAPRIGAATRLRLGLAAQRREYAGEEFDDMALAVHAGPRRVSPRWDVSLLASGFIRWFGGDPLVRAVGSRIEATHYPSPRLSLAGVLSAQAIDNARDDSRDGALYGLTLALQRPLDPTSAAGARVNVIRQVARASAHSNWNLELAANYTRELPGGFTMGLEAGIGAARFDDPLAVFGKTRADHSASARLSLLNRHVVLSRFTPHRVELGLTTVF